MKNNFLIIILGLNLFLSINGSVAQQKSTKKLVSKKMTSKKTCCTTVIPNRLGIINSSSTSVSNSLKIIRRIFCNLPNFQQSQRTSRGTS